MRKKSYAEQQAHIAFINSEPLQKKVNYEKEGQYARQCMQRCPLCGTYASVITNAHCVKEHGVTKKEIEAIHGKIIAEGTKRVQSKRAISKAAQ